MNATIKVAYHLTNILLFLSNKGFSLNQYDFIRKPSRKRSLKNISLLFTKVFLSVEFETPN